MELLSLRMQNSMYILTKFHISMCNNGPGIRFWVVITAPIMATTTNVTYVVYYSVSTSELCGIMVLSFF